MDIYLKPYARLCTHVETDSKIPVNAKNVSNQSSIGKNKTFYAKYAFFRYRTNAPHCHWNFNSPLTYLTL
jgi:hypothetical protein